MNYRIPVICIFLALFSARAEEASPRFDQIYQLLRTNLAGVTPAQLDQAAVRGLTDQFPGQVILVNSNTTSGTNTPPACRLFDSAYAYFRLGVIGSNTSVALRQAYEHTIRTNKTPLKGVVLDLRFASGSDYAAAASVADVFLNGDQALLNWGEGSARTLAKTNAVSVSLAVLINHETSGAAEALAAILHQSHAGLILGQTTAGQAHAYKTFPLDDGGMLRIATGPVQLGDGSSLRGGLRPDIKVDSSLADDHAVLLDPYKPLHATAPAGPGPEAAATKPSHRTNEAELVRERRAGETSDESNVDTADEKDLPASPIIPVLADGALARALDLLKGLAVMQESHPG